MLELKFKDELSQDGMKKVFEILRDYALKYNFDDADVYLTVAVYFADSQKVLDLLVNAGISFLSEIKTKDTPFFTEGFAISDVFENTMGFESSSADYKPEFSDQKPHMAFMNYSPSPEKATPSPQPVNVSEDLERVLHQMAADRDALKESLLREVRQSISSEQTVLRNEIIQQISRVQLTPTAQQATSSPSNIPPMQSAMNFATPQIPASAQNRRYSAKNEMLANGITCEQCRRTLKGEAINMFVESLQNHVLEHFNEQFPHFKRFKCRDCPGIETNFVNDIEKHLKNHGALIPLPERRRRLVVQLMSPQYLQTLAETAHSCFSEVFERDPIDISLIEMHSTPQKAKREVFPHLMRDFCRRNNIPDQRMNVRRSGGPVPVVNLF